MARTRQGAKVRVIVVVKREAFFKKGGQAGTTPLSVPKGTVLVAATDEIGGNIFVETVTEGNVEVLLPLAEGEWEPA